MCLSYTTIPSTEIPELQKILENFNDSHSRVLNYVSEAHGILSLIQGANITRGVRHLSVCLSSIVYLSVCHLSIVCAAEENIIVQF